MCSCGVGKLKMNEIQVNLPTPRSDRIKQSDSLNFSNAARSVSSSVLALLFFAGLGYLIWLGAAAMEYRWQWYRIEPFFFRSVDNEIIWGPLVKGLIQTLKLAGMAGFFAILIGLFTAFARLSNSISGRVISTFYLESIRNTPLLVQLFLFYFVLAPIFGIDRF
jgi:polar amino acid transport system permease protein